MVMLEGQFVNSGSRSGSGHVVVFEGYFLNGCSR